MSNRSTGTDWRSSFSDYMGSTDANLRSSRIDVSPRLHRLEPGAINPRSPILRSPADGSRVGMARGDPIVGAKSELGSLLTAVQGSLAELRVEVSAAKRLSTNASAAVSEASPSGFSTSTSRMPSRPSSAPRQRQPFGSVFQPPLYDQRYSTQEHESWQHSVLPMQQGASPSKAVNDDVVRVLEYRMAELGHNIEERVNNAIASALAQRQAVNSPEQRQAVNGSEQRQAVNGMEQRQAVNGHESAAKDVPVQPPTSYSIFMMSMHKSDAAEKVAAEAQATVSALEQKLNCESAELPKRILLASSYLFMGIPLEIQGFAQSVKLIDQAQGRVGSEILAQKELVQTVADATRQAHRDFTDAQTELLCRLEDSASSMREIDSRVTSVAVANASAIGAIEGKTSSALSSVSSFQNQLKSQMSLSGIDPQVSSMSKQVQLCEAMINTLKTQVEELEEKQSKCDVAAVAAEKASAIRSALKVRFDGDPGASSPQRSNLGGSSPRSSDFSLDTCTLGGPANGTSDDLESRIQALESQIGAVGDMSRVQGCAGEPVKDKGTAQGVSKDKDTLIMVKTLQMKVQHIESHLAEQTEGKLDQAAQEARMEVTEEFARDAYRAVVDKVEPKLEELEKMLQELKAAGVGAVDVAAGGGAALSRGIPTAPAGDEPKLDGDEKEVKGTGQGMGKDKDTLIMVKTLQMKVQHIESHLAEQTEGKLDQAAQEARIEVTEEFARDAYRAVVDKLEPKLEELEKIVQELKAAGVGAVNVTAGGGAALSHEMAMAPAGGGVSLSREMAMAPAGCSAALPHEVAPEPAGHASAVVVMNDLVQSKLDKVDAATAQYKDLLISTKTLQLKVKHIEEHLQEGAVGALDAAADAARMEVTEEMARDAYRGLVDTVEPKMEELEKRIEELEKKVEDLSKLNATMSTVSADGPGLHETVQELEKKIEELINSNATKATASASDRGLHETVQELEKKIEELVDLNATKSTASAAGPGLRETVQELEKKIEELINLNATKATASAADPGLHETVQELESKFLKSSSSLKDSGITLKALQLKVKNIEDHLVEASGGSSDRQKVHELEEMVIDMRSTNTARSLDVSAAAAGAALASDRQKVHELEEMVMNLKGSVGDSQKVQEVESRSKDTLLSVKQLELKARGRLIGNLKHARDNSQNARCSPAGVFVSSWRVVLFGSVTFPRMFVGAASS
eukprot:gene26066-11769_t